NAVPRRSHSAKRLMPARTAAALCTASLPTAVRIPIAVTTTASGTRHHPAGLAAGLAARVLDLDPLELRDPAVHADRRAPDQPEALRDAVEHHRVAGEARGLALA